MGEESQLQAGAKGARGGRWWLVGGRGPYLNGERWDVISPTLLRRAAAAKARGGTSDSTKSSTRPLASFLTYQLPGCHKLRTGITGGCFSFLLTTGVRTVAYSA